MLELRGIEKNFGAAAALAGASLHLRAGEVHALMGENGAGKSTLIKVINGVNSPDAGELILGGQPYRPRSVAHAQALGVATVFQEINLVPALSVAENIFLGREPTRFGRIPWGQVRRGARAALARLGLELDVDRPLEEFSIAVQQMTAIARAMDQNARVLILDEATSSLDQDEVRALFTLLRELKAKGVAILLVTHFLDQAYAIADRMTVLRNGAFVGEFEPGSLSRLKLVAKMMGQSTGELASPERPSGVERKARPAWLEVRGLAGPSRPAHCDFSLSQGETVGIAGLLGAGRSEVARMLFGLERPRAGEILVDGKSVQLGSPAAAMSLGFAFIPEDRKQQSIFPGLTLRENLVLALQAKRGLLRRIPRAEQRKLTSDYLARLRIKATGSEQSIETLSGGNQQKVILARWLATEPRLFLLDEPTRGIDVGAKAEIQRLLEGLAAEGLSLLFISSELEESVRVCERVVVLHHGRTVAELSGEALREAEVMRFLAGAGEAAHGV